MLKRPLVADVMTKDVVTVRPDTSYKHVVELLTRHRISGLPVVDATAVVVDVVNELTYKEKAADRVPAARSRTAAWPW
ncbi:MAG: CBS domain-containing protein [Streptosporangiales bacterium]|nr:CBS domain-containing protein [Streptosporangiales bacterium]MBO0891220.1 CBS domain-containing protein [Acidothermales bacterium]